MPEQDAEQPQAAAPDRFAFSTFMDALPDAILIVHPSGRIVEASIRATALFGYERTELVDQPIEMLVPERLRNRHVDQRGRYNQSPHVRPMGAGLDLVARRKDGSEFPVEISLGPYQLPDGPTVVAVIRNLAAHAGGDVG